VDETTKATSIRNPYVMHTWRICLRICSTIVIVAGVILDIVGSVDGIFVWPEMGLTTVRTFVHLSNFTPFIEQLLVDIDI
jgi:hypothetical protein